MARPGRRTPATATPRHDREEEGASATDSPASDEAEPRDRPVARGPRSCPALTQRSQQQRDQPRGWRLRASCQSASLAAAASASGPDASTQAKAHKPSTSGADRRRLGSSCPIGQTSGSNAATKQPNERIPQASAGGQPRKPRALTGGVALLIGLHAPTSLRRAVPLHHDAELRRAPVVGADRLVARRAARPRAARRRCRACRCSCGPSRAAAPRRAPRDRRWCEPPGARTTGRCRTTPPSGSPRRRSPGGR